MIITDKSDIFQKLLKDVEDIKIKLNPYTKYYVGCDPIEEKKESAPVFKAGDWVVRVIGKPSMGRETGRVFRIASTQGSQVYAEDKTSHFSSSLRFATEDEIKDHLVDKAVALGFTKGCKFMWNKDREITEINFGYIYVRSEDALIVGVKERDCRRSIYRRGSWASVVSYPNTTSELERLLKKFASKYYGSDLFAERDSDVEEFLKNNGYK